MLDTFRAVQRPSCHRFTALAAEQLSVQKVRSAANSSDRCCHRFLLSYDCMSLLQCAFIAVLTDLHSHRNTGIRHIGHRSGSLPPAVQPLALPVFSVLTRDAIGELRGIHERMPMILRREDIDAWVRPDGNPQEVSRRALTEMCFENAG